MLDTSQLDSPVGSVQVGVLRGPEGGASTAVPFGWAGEVPPFQYVNAVHPRPLAMFCSWLSSQITLLIVIPAGAVIW